MNWKYIIKIICFAFFYNLFLGLIENEGNNFGTEFAGDLFGSLGLVLTAITQMKIN